MPAFIINVGMTKCALSDTMDKDNTYLCINSAPSRPVMRNTSVGAVVKTKVTKVHFTHVLCAGRIYRMTNAVYLSLYLKHCFGA